MIVAEEGIGGLWKGNAANLLRIAPFKVSLIAAHAYHSWAFKLTSAQDLTYLVSVFSVLYVTPPVGKIIFATFEM